MTFADYIGKTEYDIIHFTFSLVNDIDKKLQNKKLFYKNQVIHYVEKQIKLYVTSLSLKKSLETIYIAEIEQLLNRKLNKLFEKHSVLRCI
ncbi:hypothetical protein [Metabacillus fastidiosus]|uniref:hypothetical protein n=1 Tax=Metabacillus fastidiosus TaxID=1458 RepID=UPI003D2C1FCD